MYGSNRWNSRIIQRTGSISGRGMLEKILLDEVEPTCHPLGPSNKLIFSPGLLVGHMLSSYDRISIGAKSPLTGGIKESNAGGSTGLLITRLGIKALILEQLTWALPSLRRNVQAVALWWNWLMNQQQRMSLPLKG